MTTARPLILASTSPRRRELLQQLGVPFAVVPPRDVPEVQRPGEVPQAMAERLALAKAESVAQMRPDARVLGSDTIVVCEGVVFGKPLDDTDAARMLRLLCGRTHDVITAVALVCMADGMRTVQSDTARVTLRPLVDEEIAAYVATGEPTDKAGAYAAQGIGRQLIAHIEGDETTVIGLPLTLVRQYLK